MGAQGPLAISNTLIVLLSEVSVELAFGRGRLTRTKGQDNAWLEPSMMCAEGCVGIVGRQACPEQQGWCGGNDRDGRKETKNVCPASSFFFFLVLWKNGETLYCK